MPGVGKQHTEVMEVETRVVPDAVAACIACRPEEEPHASDPGLGSRDSRNNSAPAVVKIPEICLPKKLPKAV